MAEVVQSGSCACGAVRFTTRGRPIRVGLCHCMNCRKTHGSAFNAFVVFASKHVDLSGELRSWRSATGYEERFCPVCGSHVLGINGAELELSIGCFDNIGIFEPEYESWVIRREPWVAPLDVPQNEHDRTPT